MYLSWAIIGIGLTVLFNSLWLAIATLVATMYIHVITIPREEQALQRTFGTQYETYRKRVRRWL